MGLKGATLRGSANAAAYGRSRVYLGAAEHWGAVVDGSSAAFGKVESGTTFDKATVQLDQGVSVDRQHVLFQFKQAKVELTSSEAALRMGKKHGFRFHGGGIEIRGKVLHVDA
jgi:hypothetical protein